MILSADLLNYLITFQFFPEFRKALLETQCKEKTHMHRPSPQKIIGSADNVDTDASRTFVH